MIRKIVKQGNNAYTITLPKKWVVDNNLENGEVRVNEVDKELLISSLEVSSHSVKSISIVLHPDTKETYRSIIGSLYRQGYDEIRVELEDSSSSSVLEDAISTLFGLELFTESSCVCSVRSIYSSENTSIRMHVLRILSGIEMMQHIIISEMEVGKFNSFDEIQRIRNSILKQRDLIFRLVKKSTLDIDFVYYTITISLWGVVRNYYHLYTSLSDKDSRRVELMKRVNEFVNESFLFVKKPSSDVLKMYSSFDSLRNELQERLLENVVSSFGYHIVIETQLAYSSLYLLAKESI